VSFLQKLYLVNSYTTRYTSGRSVDKAEGLAVNQGIGRNMWATNMGLGDEHVGE